MRASARTRVLGSLMGVFPELPTLSLSRSGVVLDLASSTKGTVNAPADRAASPSWMTSVSSAPALVWASVALPVYSR